MKHKYYFRAAFLLIATLCWVDYQFFTEGYAHRYSAAARQAGHIVILSAIIPVGYFGWKNYPVTYLKRIWLISYAAATVSIALVGLMQYKFQLFSMSFLDNVSTLRLFFCSPVPYFMLYIAGKVFSQNFVSGENNKL